MTDLDAAREKLRASAIADHEVAVAKGLCAKRPAGLLGPTCEMAKDHEGRCDWGRWFEPDGSFHAHDPHGEYPITRVAFPELGTP